MVQLDVKTALNHFMISSKRNMMFSMLGLMKKLKKLHKMFSKALVYMFHQEVVMILMKHGVSCANIEI